MGVTLDPAARAAMADYRVYRRLLENEARALEKERRPLEARKVMFKARIVARARLAEEFDPPPRGLP